MVNFEKYYDSAQNKLDLEQFPALRLAKGYELILDHGDTLFMPAGYWHHMEYIDSGFAMSLRHFNPACHGKLKGAWNLFGMRHLDTLMKKTARNGGTIIRRNKTFADAGKEMETVLGKATGFS